MLLSLQSLTSSWVSVLRVERAEGPTSYEVLAFTGGAAYLAWYKNRVLDKVLCYI